MLSTREILCPDNLLRMAQGAGPLRTAVVGADSALALDSARLAADAGLIEPVLVGDAARIAAAAAEIGWDIAGLSVEPAAAEDEMAAIAARLGGEGKVAALMKGHIHTDTLMAAVLAPGAGLRTERRMSHIFHMSFPGSDRPLLITDAALNIAPNLETKKAILLSAVDLAKALGMATPRVAVLSASETPNERMPSSVEARDLSLWAETAVPDALVLGPLAFDNVVSAEAARLKGIDHPVAGNADVVLVPSIECGNALFKAMVYLNSACAAGVVVGGRIPVMLTSRADAPSARLASAALAVIAARGGT